ncbi:cell wall hydrolase [Roseibium album]|uniref:cell wall hydrolase n=1 Tax=Roseibium album TaxID=311410 RepID=UPI003BB0F0C9
MTVAKSVIDVILGEAKAGSYEDMLAIASVIENRSKQLGVSPEQVVQVQSEFNAYGKSIPPGNDQHRELAEKAIEQVRSQGPIHSATFYATPAASKNLPSGLEAVTATDGHNFYSDPQNRSIRTSSGFRAPQNSLLSFAATGPTPPSPAPRNGQEAIDAAMNVGSPLRNRSQQVSGIEPRNPFLSYSNAAAIRNKPVTSELEGILSRASDATGGYGFDINSGGQPKIGSGLRRTGSTRHDDLGAGGRAADGALTLDGERISYNENPGLYENFARQAGVQGATGLGHYGWGVHVDNARPNSPIAWGPNRTSATVNEQFKDAFNEGVSARNAGLYSELGPRSKPDVSGLPVIAGTMPQSQPASYSEPSAIRETAPNPAGMSIGGVSGQGALPVAPTYVSAVRPTPVQPVSSRPVNPAQPSRQTTVDAYQQFAQSRAAPAQLPTVPGAAYVSPSSLPQVTPDVQPLPDVAISAPVIEAPKQQDLPKIDAPVVSGVGVPKSKPSAPKKPKQISKQLGQIAGGVLGGMIAGPFGAIPGALIGRQLGKAGLPQMGPLSLGPLVSAEGFGRTATGQAVNAATRGGGFDNAAYTRAYAAAGGSDDPKSYSRALAEEQRQRSRSGQKTVADAFGGWF